MRIRVNIDLIKMIKKSFVVGFDFISHCKCIRTRRDTEYTLELILIVTRECREFTDGWQLWGNINTRVTDTR